MKNYEPNPLYEYVIDFIYLPMSLLSNAALLFRKRFTRVPSVFLLCKQIKLFYNSPVSLKGLRTLQHIVKLARGDMYKCYI